MGETDFEAKVKAWSELTCSEYMDVVLYFLFSTKEDRHFIMRLLKRSGRDFKNLVITKNDNEKRPLFYDIYSKNYEYFDSEVRFGDELDKLFAMWIKMYALGMTYEEVLKDSERRNAWTPLNEKRPGNW